MKNTLGTKWEGNATTCTYQQQEDEISFVEAVNHEKPILAPLIYDH